MSYQRSHGHSVSNLTVHIVWSTKYRYPVLQGDLKERCRSLLIQVCESEDVEILKGVVSWDHIHMHVSYRPSLSISNLVKRMKGHSSRKLQQEFPLLKSDIGDDIFGLLDMVVGVQGILLMKWLMNIWSIIGNQKMAARIIL